MILSYPFSNSSNYIFDASKIEVVGGVAKLKLRQGNIDFTEEFNGPSGFVYDPSLAEFYGGILRQKDQRPSNSIIAADFNSSFDANWGAEGILSLVASVHGSPSLISGKVLCDYSVNSGENSISYSDQLIGDLSGDWVVKFKYTPNYSTSPPENVNIFSKSQPVGTTNQLIIFNSPSGNNVRVTAPGLSANVFDTWIPVSGQEYVFEVHCVSNQITLYIDGVQLGNAKTTSGLGTTATTVWLGAYPNIYNAASGLFDDFILYSSATQSESYSIPVTKYNASVVICPEMEHIGDGSILTFNAFSASLYSSVRFALQIGRSGNYLYWDGSSWVVSDGSYSQSNDVNTFNDNVGSLAVSGEKYGQFKVFFQSSNYQAWIASFTANLNTNIGYSTDNPTIYPSGRVRMEDLLGVESVFSVSGSDLVRWVIDVGGQFKYWNGSGWVVSDGSYSQSSTISEISSNASSLLDNADVVRWVAFLHSDSGLTYPEIDSVTIEYDFGGEIRDEFDKCVVWWYMDSGDVNVWLENDGVQYKSNVLLRRNDFTFKVEPNGGGYCEVELPYSSDMEMDGLGELQKFIFLINGEKHRVSIPSLSTANLFDLII